MNALRFQRVRRGVSLIEAVVALAVMAFGLVAIVGLQATLRSNSDVSRQRAEALRLAQQEIERWRAFATLQGGPGVNFADIASLDSQIVGRNATYAVRRTVPVQQAPAPLTVAVNVSWTDRTGQDQNVSLNTTIAGISPELAGALVLPQNQGIARRVNNRSPLIPRMAKNFGDGTSGFVPPQTTGRKVAWVFNNVSGVIERVCAIETDVSTDTLQATAVAATLDSCDTSRTAQLLSGYVNFANPAAQPDEAEAEAPTGLALNLDMELTLASRGHPSPGYECFDDSPQEFEQSARPVAYYCAIYSNPDRKWSGRLRVLPLAFVGSTVGLWTIGTGDAREGDERTVCRYTTLTGDGTSTSKNSAHPLDYTVDGSVRGAALRDQNFLVISGSHTCPVDALSSTDMVNANTRVHQNGIQPYI